MADDIAQLVLSTSLGNSPRNPMQYPQSRTVVEDVTALLRPVAGNTPNKIADAVLGKIGEINTQQAVQDKQYKAKITETAQAQELADQQRAQAVADQQAALLHERDVVQLGVNSVAKMLGIDPANPVLDNTTLGKNNIAITDVNAKLLAKKEEYDSLQGDDFASGFKRFFLEGGVKSDLQELSAIRSTFVKANDDIIQQLANQTVSLQGIAHVNDTAAAVATARGVTAEAESKALQGRFTNLKDIASVDYAQSEQAKAAALQAGTFAMNTYSANLSAAIQSKQLANLGDDAMTKKLIQNATGWDDAKYELNMAAVRKNPQLGNELLYIGMTGDYTDQAAVERLASLQDRKGLTDPNGNPLPMLQLTQEATQPGIRSRVAARTTEFAQALAASNTYTADQRNEIMADPFKRRAAFDTWAKANPEQNIESDLVQANPVQIMKLNNVLPPSAQIKPPKLIADYLANMDVNSNASTLNIAPSDFIAQLVSTNPDTNPAIIGQQVAEWYRQVLGVEKGRKIYQATGLMPPTKASVKALPISALDSISGFATGTLAKAGIVSSGFDYSKTAPSQDLLNAAQMTAYVRNYRRLHDMRNPTGGAK